MLKKIVALILLGAFIFALVKFYALRVVFFALVGFLFTLSLLKELGIRRRNRKLKKERATDKKATFNKVMANEGISLEVSKAIYKSFHVFVQRAFPPRPHDKLRRVYKLGSEEGINWAIGNLLIQLKGKDDRAQPYKHQGTNKIKTLIDLGHEVTRHL